MPTLQVISMTRQQIVHLGKVDRHQLVLRKRQVDVHQRKRCQCLGRRIRRVQYRHRSNVQAVCGPVEDGGEEIGFACEVPVHAGRIQTSRGSNLFDLDVVVTVEVEELNRFVQKTFPLVVPSGASTERRLSGAPWRPQANLVRSIATHALSRMRSIVFCGNTRLCAVILPIALNIAATTSFVSCSPIGVSDGDKWSPTRRLSRIECSRITARSEGSRNLLSHR